MGATFPVMEKCLVNGEQAHLVFKCLRKQTPCFYNDQTGKIKNIPFNFSKFILDDKGHIIAYLNPRESIYVYIDEIEACLGLQSNMTKQEAL